ncbi:biogenesis of lysosome-related organelles complex 1 subunit 5 [Hyalella azteca]|uniref:Biogenesis of lysosome-related organelles complex 1 subunit 5 n=1 Tax=Hyalella azteca TaxID=294128 RepID=A0A8B7N586_HYAAZ|nr:biogenesis of lysosome-related organelles complex 1 subunit 5 [Hyalella azteca]
MAITSEVEEVFSRLFDHRPFLKGEISFFKREFEEKRGDREVEELFRALELTTEIKQAQVEKVVEASDANLPRTIADIQVALRMCHTSLDSDSRTSRLSSEIERQREDRQQRLAVAKAEVEAKLASINAAYDLKEKELREKFAKLDSSNTCDS